MLILLWKPNSMSSGHEEDKEEKVSSTPQGETYSEIIGKKIESLKREFNDLLLVGKPLQAIGRINRAFVHDPRDASLYQLRGEAFFQLRDYPSAIQNISKALRLAPSNSQYLEERLAVTHGCYGDLLYEEGQYKQALHQFNLVYEVLPEYLLKCITCYIGLKDYQPAMELLQSKLDHGAPKDKAELLVMRARLHLLFGNATSCYHDVQAALQLDSSLKEAIALKTQLERRTFIARKQAIDYCLTEKRREALRKIDIAIGSDPHNAKHHILRGALHRELHSYNKAIDDFILAMDKCSHSYEQPTYQEASKQLVLTFNDFAVDCFKKECYSEAITLINKAIKEEKKESGLYINRGDCFYKQGEYQFALADYQQAYEMSPCHTNGLQYRLAVVHFTLGMMEFSSNVLASAEGHFTAALHHSPYTSRFYICRARTRNDLKKLSEAQEDIIFSLLLSPTNTECLPLVAQLFPGISAQDLVSSDQAKELKLQLKLQINVQSSAHKENSIPTDNISANIRQLLDEIGLIITCIQSTDNDASCKDDPRVLQQVPDQVPQRSDSDEPSLSPRSWVILKQPLPVLLKSTGIPPLQYCMEEEEFHALIFYTKKTCTDDVHKVLYAPLEYPDPLPKVTDYTRNIIQ